MVGGQRGIAAAPQRRGRLPRFIIAQPRCLCKSRTILVTSVLYHIYHRRQLHSHTAGILRLQYPHRFKSQRPTLPDLPLPPIAPRGELSSWAYFHMNTHPCLELSLLTLQVISPLALASLLASLAVCLRLVECWHHVSKTAVSQITAGHTKHILLNRRSARS